jgi:hypothetical protein
MSQSGIKNVSCVIRGNLEEPARRALEELDRQIRARGASLARMRYWDAAGLDDPLLITGTVQEALIKRIAVENTLDCGGSGESLSIHRCRVDAGRGALLISGGDTLGLMYALYEMADRVRCGGLEELGRDIHVEERPDLALRGVDRFIMNRFDEEWFYSRDFWDSFLQKLARNRFNRFTLITGFDTSYMTPPYPFFVEVPGFETLRVRGLSAEKRERNLETLRKIAALCVANGLVFSFGTWQQKPWTNNQQNLVENMPAGDAEFTAFCAEGVRALLESCPGIGALQFRVNMEAGITAPAGGKTNTHESFWNALIDAAAASGRPLKLDLRAKGVTDGMIAHALASGLDVSIPTKYWCEHAALPYHISKLRGEESRDLQNMNSSRRYSYSNLLKKPRWYDVIFRLWNYGSTNVFLWADTDYVRRFSESLRLAGSYGFEINTPLSLKGGMEARAESPWALHRDPSVINYRWEDERYWAYYLAFGRWGYSGGADPEVIRREFVLRFGGAGPALLDAYETAAKILPLITTIHFPVHPSLHYWPELYPGAALFAKNNYDPSFGAVDYASALPSDEELFYSIAEYAEDEAAGTFKTKYNPLYMGNQLHGLAEKVRDHLRRAGCSANDAANDRVVDSKEKLATWVDFSMVAGLADFHAWKIWAAYYLCSYRRDAAGDNLAKAYSAMLRARSFWAELSALGNRYYHHDLQFNAGAGVARHKNWQERLEKEVDADLACLEALLAGAGRDIARDREAVAALPDVEPSGLRIQCKFPETCSGGQDLHINARVEGEALGDAPVVLLNYRHMDHTEGEYRHVPMERRGEEYHGLIPGDYLTPGFTQGLSPGFDVIVYLSALDAAGRAIIYPGINHPVYAGPYAVIRLC